MENNTQGIGSFWDNWEYDSTKPEELSSKELIIDKVARSTCQATESSASSQNLETIQKQYSLLNGAGFGAIKQAVNKAFSYLPRINIFGASNFDRLCNE